MRSFDPPGYPRRRKRGDHGRLRFLPLRREEETQCFQERSQSTPWEVDRGMGKRRVGTEGTSGTRKRERQKEENRHAHTHTHTHTMREAKEEEKKSMSRIGKEEKEGK